MVIQTKATKQCIPLLQKCEKKKRQLGKVRKTKRKVSYHVMSKDFTGSVHLLNFAYNHTTLYKIKETACN